VTLVGDGPERDRLEDLAQTLGLADVVVFEGFRSDPLAFMQRASIFALPSRFEGMPNALLEAMAAGLPAVVTDASPGPLEMVTDQIHGLVVPRNNPSCFAEALKCLIQSPELRVSYGQAGPIQAEISRLVGGRAALAIGVGSPPSLMELDPAGTLLVFAPTRRAVSETFIRANLAGLPFQVEAYFGDEFPLLQPLRFLYRRRDSLQQSFDASGMVTPSELASCSCCPLAHQVEATGCGVG
jgi:glycosyltransferase involved in cell wall biosynthesis